MNWSRAPDSTRRLHLQNELRIPKQADGISEVAKGEEEIPERLSRYTLGKDLIAQQLLAGQVSPLSKEPQALSCGR